MKKILLLLILFTATTTSVFASIQTGTIIDIYVRDDGLHSITLSGNRSTKPACATYNYWMIKDENSTYGKAQYSLLLAAYMSGKTVKITGRDTCTRWVDGEDIRAVSLK